MSVYNVSEGGDKRQREEEKKRGKRTKVFLKVELLQSPTNLSSTVA